jgi:hypothetical protein
MEEIKYELEKEIKKIFPENRYDIHGIFKNLRENQIFWEQYKNPLEPLFKSSYDNYLKLNGQESGIKSYNQTVALLVVFYNENEFEFLN